MLTIRVSSRLGGSGTRGAVLDASNWAASRPELGLEALTPRLFCFDVGDVVVNQRTGGKEGERAAYCFHPLFGGGGCLGSAIFGGLRRLPH
jgi:hypothetical protein